MRANRLELSKANRELARSSTYHFCEIGRGVVDFPVVLHALRDFPGWLIVETDGYEVPPGGRGRKPANQQEGPAEARADLTELDANVMFLAARYEERRKAF